MAKINDFGEKIGGARKDLWKTEGLQIKDLEGMTSLEKKKYIKKDNIWPKINVQEQLDNGVPRFIVYWQNEMRKAVKPVPNENIDSETYIEGVRTIRSMVEQVKTESDILYFADKAVSGIILEKQYSTVYDYVGSYRDIVNGNAILRLRSVYNLSAMKTRMNRKNFGLDANEIMKKDFPIVQIDSQYHQETVMGKESIVKERQRGKYYYYPQKGLSIDDAEGKFMLLHGNSIIFISEDRKKCEAAQEEAYARIRRKQADKKVSKSKKKWIPPQLENLVMESSSPRSGHMTGEHMLNYFGIIGGEFGNYENDADRQVSLDYAFDSFCDIAEALGIDYKTTSLPKLSRGGLSIAFGARGRGAAVAHYEFLREVINVTKIRGAGSLGHEWGHALDHMIGQLYECPELATEAGGYNMPATIKKILQDIKYDDHGNLSKYYSDSMKFNSTYNKMGHGYWTSNCELFARAFACYLADKLREKGYRNDYLNGLANAYVIKDDESEKKCYAYPRGEERIRINHAIDELIADLKKSGIFTTAKEKKHSSEIFYTCSKDGQMRFC